MHSSYGSNKSTYGICGLNWASYYLWGYPNENYSPLVLANEDVDVQYYCTITSMGGGPVRLAGFLSEPPRAAISGSASDILSVCP
eukprot:scaffold403088_cov38-Prasinocladus_malaysianus.AAC.3